MDRLDAVRGFLAVADHASFAEAARHLRWSPATATRAVASLEAELGVALFSRTTRAVRLTERGALFAEKAREILTEIESARSLVRGEHAAPRGTLSITAPVLFGRLHVLPVAEALGATYPDLAIRLALVDRVAHLVEEGFDVAVRIGALADSALVAVKVAEVRRVVVASPAYLERAGSLGSPADLRRHRIVSFEGVGSTNTWRFGTRGETVVRVSPQLSINSADAVIDAVERGQGVTRLLSYQVRPALAAGRLCRVLAKWEPEAVPISLLYQARRRASPNIQAFVAEARRHFTGTQLA